MSNEILKDIKFDHFKNIEELIQHLEMWYAEDDYDEYNRFFGLRDARIMGMIIYQLQQENKQLKEDKRKAIEYIKEHIKYECDIAFNGMQFYSHRLYDFSKEELLEILGDK